MYNYVIYALAALAVLIAAGSIFFSSSEVKKYKKLLTVGTTSLEECYYVFGVGLLAVIFILVNNGKGMDKTVAIIYLAVLLLLSVCAFMIIASKVLISENEITVIAPFKKPAVYDIKDVTVKKEKGNYVFYVNDKKLCSLSQKDKRAEKLKEIFDI